MFILNSTLFLFIIRQKYFNDIYIYLQALALYDMTLFTLPPSITTLNTEEVDLEDKLHAYVKPMHIDPSVVNERLLDVEDTFLTVELCAEQLNTFEDKISQGAILIHALASCIRRARCTRLLLYRSNNVASYRGYARYIDHLESLHTRAIRWVAYLRKCTAHIRAKLMPEIERYSRNALRNLNSVLRNKLKIFSISDSEEEVEVKRVRRPVGRPRNPRKENIIDTDIKEEEVYDQPNDYNNMSFATNNNKSNTGDYGSIWQDETVRTTAPDVQHGLQVYQFEASEQGMELPLETIPVESEEQSQQAPLVSQDYPLSSDVRKEMNKYLVQELMKEREDQDVARVAAINKCLKEDDDYKARMKLKNKKPISFGPVDPPLVSTPSEGLKAHLLPPDTPNSMNSMDKLAEVPFDHPSNSNIESTIPSINESALNNLVHDLEENNMNSQFGLFGLDNHTVPHESHLRPLSASNSPTGAGGGIFDIPGMNAIPQGSRPPHQGGRKAR